MYPASPSYLFNHTAPDPIKDNPAVGQYCLSDLFYRESCKAVDDLGFRGMWHLHGQSHSR